MATVTTARMTAEEFCEWASRPENQDKFHELDEGVPVEMPPPGEVHGALCGFIAHLLWQYVLRHGKGYVCSNDTGLLVKQGPDTVRGPGLMLFDENRKLDDMSPKYTARVPALVVEVVSPSDQMSKLNRRIAQYLKRGVPLVWLVDPEVRCVTVYRKGKDHHVVDETEELTGEDVLPDLRYRVAELFTLPGQ